MRLVHYASTTIREIVSVEQTDLDGCVFDKPKGFWVSVEDTGYEDGWRDWCLREEFGLSRLTHAHDVFLVEKANILYISSAEGIDAFTAAYSAPGRFGMRAICWHRVAFDYQGIIIAPYIWSRRCLGDAPWYYGWDCASGCIWDATAIDRVAVREK